MAIQSFTINVKGKEEIIEFEDDPPFGEMQKIIKSCIDISDVSHPQVNLQLYQQMILQTVVTKAPFDEIAQHIYAYSALCFGWDKEQVDKQPAKYLKTTVLLSKDMIQETLKNIFGALR